MNTAHDEVRKLLDQIRVCSTNPAVVRATDQIEVLSAAHLGPDTAPATPPGLDRVHFTPSEAKAMALLYSRRGRTLDRDTLLSVMAHRSDDGPDPQLVNVKMCHLRGKLKGTGYEIETVWGSGYRLVNWAGKPDQIAA